MKTVNTASLGIILVALMMGACSNGDANDPASSAPASTTAQFLGSWGCTGTATTAIPGQPDLVGPSNVTLTFAEDGADLGLDREETNGAPACHLRLTVSGETLTFVPGQTCKEALGPHGGGQPPPGTTAGQAPPANFPHFTDAPTVAFMGGGTLAGDTLTMKHTGPLTGQVTNSDGQPAPFEGTATVQDTCKRK